LVDSVPVELSGGGYCRQEFVEGDVEFQEFVEGDVEFPLATDDWGTVDYIGVWIGNQFYSAPLNPRRIICKNDILRLKLSYMELSYTF